MNKLGWPHNKFKKIMAIFKCAVPIAVGPFARRDTLRRRFVWK